MIELEEHFPFKSPMELYGVIKNHLDWGVRFPNDLGDAERVMSVCLSFRSKRPPLPLVPSSSKSSLQDYMQWCIDAQRVIDNAQEPERKKKKARREVKPKAKPAPTPCIMPGNDLKVLKALSGQDATITQEDLYAELGKQNNTISPRTINDVVKRLKEKEYVSCPHGPQKGIAITDSGKKRLTACKT
jgi:hypothetical protein